MVSLAGEGAGELRAAGLAAGLAAIFAFFGPLLPPLADLMENEWWTRVAEFLGLTLTLWIGLAFIGIVRSQVSVGPSGLSTTRLAAESAAINAASEEAVQEIRAANVEMTKRVSRLEGMVEVLLDHQLDAPSPVDRPRHDGAVGQSPHDHQARLPPRSGRQP